MLFVTKAALGLGLTLGIAFAQPPSLSVSAGPPPATVAGGFVNGAQGGGTLFYWVVTHYPIGNTISDPARVNNTVGIANLNATNSVTVRWGGQLGATGYDVIRSDTPLFPAPCAACAVATNTTAVSVNDTGGGSAYTSSGNLGSPAVGTFTLNNQNESAPFMNLSLNGSQYRVAPLSGTYTAGNVPAFGARGTLVDSGKTPSSGGVTSVATGCGTSGGTITTTGTIIATELVNPQTGTSYVILTGDCGKLVTGTNAMAQAYSIAACGSAGFATGYFVSLENRGAGDLTLTPTTSTIDGAATVVLHTGQGVKFACHSDAQYYSERGKPTLASSDIPNNAANTSGSAASAPFSGVTTGTNAAALHVGTGGSLDATGSGTIAATSCTGVGCSPPVPDGAVPYRISGTAFGGSSASFGLSSEVECVTGGLCDLTVVGTYTGAATPNVYFDLFLDNTGTPDTFQWQKCSPACGAVSLETNMSQCPTMTSLSDAITVCWTSNTGHGGEDWRIFPTAFTLPMFVKLLSSSVGVNTIYADINYLRFVGETNSAWQQQLNGPGQLAWVFYRSRGSFDVPTPVQNGDSLGDINFSSLHDVGTISTDASIAGVIDDVAGSLSHIGITLGAAGWSFYSDGRLAAKLTSASALAPGAGKANLRWVAGTNAGTCKLVTNAGTSATEVTIIDNVGGGC